MIVRLFIGKKCEMYLFNKLMNVSKQVYCIKSISFFCNGKILLQVKLFGAFSKYITFLYYLYTSHM